MLLGFLFVPVYLHYLGVEAYGLVGFFTSLRALISFLDLGLSSAVNREIALRSVSPEGRSEMRDLIRTLELVYGVAAILIVLLFVVGAGWIAEHWISVEELSIQTVRTAAIIFGITLGLRWPVALYSGVLQGSEKQVLMNGISTTVGTLGSLGAVFVIVLISPTILAYLYWQVAMAFLEVVVYAAGAWRVVTGDNTPHARFGMLRGIWRYSASVSFNSLLAALIKQMDRVLISNLLLLVQVGYYSTANAAYSALSIISSPLAAAAFPRFAALIAEKDESTLAYTYHKLSQVNSFLVAPVSGIMLFFSHDILLFWTRSEDVALNASSTLSFLALAAMFNSMMTIPFMLQLAAGITWIAVWNNAINLALLAPLMYFLISHYGIAGAGISWAVFNLLYYSIVPHVMHRHVLQSEKAKWYFADTLPFIFLGFFVFGSVYFMNIGRTSWIFDIILGCTIYVAICLSVFPVLRASLLDLLHNSQLLKKIIKRKVESS